MSDKTVMLISGLSTLICVLSALAGRRKARRQDDRFSLNSQAPTRNRDPEKTKY
jgi:hypothetical protein